MAREIHIKILLDYERQAPQRHGWAGKFGRGCACARRTTFSIGISGLALVHHKLFGLTTANNMIVPWTPVRYHATSGSDRLAFCNGRFCPVDAPRQVAIRLSPPVDRTPRLVSAEVLAYLAEHWLDAYPDSKYECRAAVFRLSPTPLRPS